MDEGGGGTGKKGSVAMGDISKIDPYSSNQQVDRRPTMFDMKARRLLWTDDLTVVSVTMAMLSLLEADAVAAMGCAVGAVCEQWLLLIRGLSE